MATPELIAMPFLALADHHFLVTTTPSPTTANNTSPYPTIVNPWRAPSPAPSPPTSRPHHHQPTIALGISQSAYPPRSSPPITPAPQASVPCMTRTLLRWSMTRWAITVQFPNSFVYPIWGMARRLVTLSIWAPGSVLVTLRCIPALPILTPTCRITSSSSPPGTCIPCTTFSHIRRSVKLPQRLKLVCIQAGRTVEMTPRWSSGRLRPELSPADPGQGDLPDSGTRIIPLLVLYLHVTGCKPRSVLL